MMVSLPGDSWSRDLIVTCTCKHPQVIKPAKFPIEIFKWWIFDATFDCQRINRSHHPIQYPQFSVIHHYQPLSNEINFYGISISHNLVSMISKNISCRCTIISHYIPCPFSATIFLRNPWASPNLGSPSFRPFHPFQPWQLVLSACGRRLGVLEQGVGRQRGRVQKPRGEQRRTWLRP